MNPLTPGVIPAMEWGLPYKAKALTPGAQTNCLGHARPVSGKLGGPSSPATLFSPAVPDRLAVEPTAPAAPGYRPAPPGVGGARTRPAHSAPESRRARPAPGP